MRKWLPVEQAITEKHFRIFVGNVEVIVGCQLCSDASFEIFASLKRQKEKHFYRRDGTSTFVQHRLRQMNSRRSCIKHSVAIRDNAKKESECSTTS